MGNSHSIVPISHSDQKTRAWLETEEEAVYSTEKYWMNKYIPFRYTRNDKKFWEALGLFRKALAEITDNPELLDRPFAERAYLVGNRSIVPHVDQILQRATESMAEEKQREWVWTKWEEEQAYREGRIFRKTLYNDLDKNDNKENKDNKEWICPICLEHENTSKIWLECGHAYHKSCWTNYSQSTQSDNCPQCRKKVHWYSDTKHTRHGWEFRKKREKGKKDKQIVRNK